MLNYDADDVTSWTCHDCETRCPFYAPSCIKCDTRRNVSGGKAMILVPTIVEKLPGVCASRLFYELQKHAERLLMAAHMDGRLNDAMAPITHVTAPQGPSEISSPPPPAAPLTMMDEAGSLDEIDLPAPRAAVMATRTFSASAVTVDLTGRVGRSDPLAPLRAADFVMVSYGDRVLGAWRFVPPPRRPDQTPAHWHPDRYARRASR